MAKSPKFSSNALNVKLAMITILPLCALSVIITFFSYFTFYSSINEQISSNLKNICSCILTTFDMMYPGDYELVGDYSYRLYKGDHDITQEYDVIDRVYEETGVHLTLFYFDTRILTTIRDQSDVRIIGTRAHDLVLNDVFEMEQPHFYQNALINQEEYFAYYAPLFNSDGTCIGMIFAGEPIANIKRLILKSVLPIFLVAIITTIITGFLALRYSRKILSVLYSIRSFLMKVATGSLNTELDYSVSSRTDELGDIGKSAINMQRSLRDMLDHDSLTRILNRHAGEQKLKQMRSLSQTAGLPFSVALGDIDFFKKVNDTYGHECGDYVLIRIAGLLRHHMRGQGYAIRWGGEEFLLVFEDRNAADALKLLDEIIQDIRNASYTYEEHTFSVTMTFGLVDGNPDMSMHSLLKIVDDKLYQGKESGRNCIIY